MHISVHATGIVLGAGAASDLEAVLRVLQPWGADLAEITSHRQGPRDAGWRVL
jgi:hypothetical protein